MRQTIFIPLLFLFTRLSLCSSKTEAIIFTISVNHDSDVAAVATTNATKKFDIPLVNVRNRDVYDDYDDTTTVAVTKPEYYNSCSGESNGISTSSSLTIATPTSYFNPQSSTSPYGNAATTADLVNTSPATTYDSSDSDDSESYSTFFFAGAPSTLLGNVSLVSAVIDAIKATFYRPGQGNCGWQLSSNFYMDAISQEVHNSDIVNPQRQSGYCGRMITPTYGSKSVGSWGECNENHLDLSQTAFAELGDISAGILNPIQ